MSFDDSFQSDFKSATVSISCVLYIPQLNKGVNFLQQLPGEIYFTTVGK